MENFPHFKQASKTLSKHQTYRFSCFKIPTNLPYIGKFNAESLCGKITIISWGTPYLETTPNVLSHVFGHGLTCSNLTLEIGQSQT